MCVLVFNRPHRRGLWGVIHRRIRGLVGWLVELGEYMDENTTNSENEGKSTFGTIMKYLKWTAVGIFAAFILLVIARMPVVYQKQKTEEQVAKIHATKLTMDDVMGVNLPPDPGAEADKTVAGIDANKNSIRDDVELAIFKEYPNSAKTRAVLLQYALALQMEVTQPIVNGGTVTAVAEDGGRAYACVGKITSRDDMKKYSEIVDARRGFVVNKQLNTEVRKKAQYDFYEGNLGSFTLPHESCDLDVLVLPN